MLVKINCRRTWSQPRKKHVVLHHLLHQALASHPSQAQQVQPGSGHPVRPKNIAHQDLQEDHPRQGGILNPNHIPTTCLVRVPSLVARLPRVPNQAAASQANPSRASCMARAQMTAVARGVTDMHRVVVPRLLSEDNLLSIMAQFVVVTFVLPIRHPLRIH